MTMSVRVSGDVRPSKALHLGLWVVQGLLGALFLAVGAMKATQPIAMLVDMLGWPAAVPGALVRVIGVAELLGGLGLIPPAATRVKPMLARPASASAWRWCCCSPRLFHISRGELGAMPIPLVLAALAAFVAWGRAAKAPIAPR